MLRGNLSTRPFYNERLASVAVGVVALIALLLTGFNIWKLTVLSSERADVHARLDADQREAERIQAEASTLRRTVDRPTLVRLAGSTREANALIDQRTFSWTTLFGLLEKTLPLDVRLVSVAPRTERNVFRVSMNVIARDLDDIDAFIDALGETGTFYDVAPTDQQRNEDATYGAVVEASYLPPVMAQPAAVGPDTPPPPAGPATTPAPAATGRGSRP